MTVNQAADELKISPRVVREFVRAHRVPTKRVLGQGRTLHIVVPAYIEKLRESNYVDEAQTIESWLRAQQAGGTAT